MYGIFTYIWVIFRANIPYMEHMGMCIYLEESYLIYTHRASTYNSRIVGIVYVCIDTHALLYDIICIYTHYAVTKMCIYIYIYHIYVHLFTHM